MSASNPTLELLKELISCPSVTPHDAGCLSIIERRLSSLGFEIERMDQEDTANLWATHGTARPLFVFAGHTDVVPTGPLEKWHSPPFSPTLRDGQLYGRGAADMKASLAAFVVACERFLQQYPDYKGSIACLLTSDEEGSARYGTQTVVCQLQARGVKLDYCLVGEPTSCEQLGDTIKNGRRGSLSGRLLVRGKQGHIAYPHLADNPIHRIAPALAELVATQWDQGNADFPPTTWQISNIQAGTGANNVIPGECQIDFNFRFSTESTADSLKQRLENILNAHGISFQLDWHLSGEAFLSPRTTLVQALSQAIQAELGIETQCSTTGGTSDGRFIAKICPQVVEFGPLNQSIHQVNECVRVDDLEPLARCYERTMRALLNLEH